MRFRSRYAAVLAATLVAAVVVVPQSRSLADTTDILVGAGDVASCRLFDPNDPSKHGERDTAGLLVLYSTANIFTVGDNSQDEGTQADYANCYDPSWGHFAGFDLKSKTRPAMGNHDYATEQGRYYYEYFGAQAGQPGQGYYGYDIGDSWHVIVINSNLCLSAGQCEKEGNPQYDFVLDQLKNHNKKCTIAYWHHPLFTSGPHSGTAAMKPLYALLNSYQTEVVLNGHNHYYERFHRQDANGKATTSGIREFVVGTGGTRANKPTSTAANSAKQVVDNFGILRFVLHSDSYEWGFVSTNGGTTLDQSDSPASCQ